MIELAGEGVRISESTVARWLRKLGINRRRDLDPSGASNRKPAGTIAARYPGHIIHVGVKKPGRIPDGDAWRAHGRGSAEHKTSPRGPPTHPHDLAEQGRTDRLRVPAHRDRRVLAPGLRRALAR
ncbi:hypothetical protein Kisp01_72710 [Kineosporia sp. NBRC 101677]|nr:hypothetical protein Kisp01_72710 [Kineosporia sp. NBRC 101677]